MSTLIFVLAIVALAIYVAFKSKKKSTLKEQYEQSLKGTDKRAALDAGRAYYSYLRNGKTLTIYDEQAITNDLSTMSVSS